MARVCQGRWPLDKVLPPLSTEYNPVLREIPCSENSSSCWRFSHMHLDLVAPLPSCQGYSYLLTVIDRTSRWSEVVPLSSITSKACAGAFTSTWVSRFGVPALLTSDRGSQFTSSVWSELCSILGILRIKTTSFHPQSKGMIERFHHSLKSSLRARLAGSEWVSHLPLVMLGL